MRDTINKATFPLPCLRQARLELVEGFNNGLQFARLTYWIKRLLA